MGATNTEESVILNLLFGAPGTGVAATYHFALFTVAPTDSTPGTEVSGGSYARVAVTNNTTNFPASTGGASKANGVAITFPVATAPWGTAVAWGAFDASTAGTLRYYDDLDPHVAVGVGAAPSFTIGAWTMECQ